MPQLKISVWLYFFEKDQIIYHVLPGPVRSHSCLFPISSLSIPPLAFWASITLVFFQSFMFHTSQYTLYTVVLVLSLSPSPSLFPFWYSYSRWCFSPRKLLIVLQSGELSASDSLVVSCTLLSYHITYQ